MAVDSEMALHATSYKELERTLREPVAANDEQRTFALLSDLDRGAQQVLAEREVRGAIELSARLERLGANLGGTHEPLAYQARGYLRATMSRLDEGLAVLNQERDVQERAEEAAEVRERVAARLALGPTRSGAIAEALTLHPSQVSRALRELLADGRVRKVASPRSERDRRAQYYEAADASRRAPARARHAKVA